MIDTKVISKRFKELKQNVTIVVDNSWLSATYNPLDYNADVLVESLSKYMGGGDLIMGMVTGRNGGLLNTIMKYAHENGIRTSQFDAYSLKRASNSRV
jgi:cystathionine beta-lyase/cystathionine gamma-synthase